LLVAGNRTVMATDTAPVETVLFDLDHTLVRYQRTSGEVLQASFEACALDPLFSVEEYYARFDELRQEHNSIESLRAACFGTLADEHGYDPSLGREVATAYTEIRDQTNVEFVPGARDVLAHLDGAVDLGVVTNGTGDAQRAKIETMGLEQWIEATVFAGESVPAKPDTAPFERALDSLDGTPETTVHVGDSLGSDVAGANAAGIRSVWFSEVEADGMHTPTHRIGSITELLDIVEVA
jgi:HAD superfamily hydrolase (TIGR01549 family)